MRGILFDKDSTLIDVRATRLARLSAYRSRTRRESRQRQHRAAPHSKRNQQIVDHGKVLAVDRRKPWLGRKRRSGNALDRVVASSSIR